jgi:hypothetical protein
MAPSGHFPEARTHTCSGGAFTDSPKRFEESYTSMIDRSVAFADMIATAGFGSFTPAT